VEIWQANAAGRYRHQGDQHPAPLDPNFSGAGRCETDAEGRYHFVTIKPGAYPWGNHPNAWRPQHIHFSLLGRAFPQRLVTQMYFPGDPLFEYDPIFNSVRDERARRRMVSRFDIATTKPDWALAYEFDIVLSGRAAPRLASSTAPPRDPVADRRPVLVDRQPWPTRRRSSATPARCGHIPKTLGGTGDAVPDAIVET
jgi:protocatechuate 3,4-dioxygenase beta subunit